MNRKKQHIPAKRRLNYYSKWQYALLITIIVIMGFSALPTWFGDKPSIQVTASQTDAIYRDPLSIKHILTNEGVDVVEIRQAGVDTTIVLENEIEQAKAKRVLQSSLASDTELSFAYVSVAPHWLRDLGMKPIKLGLDLRGGVQFLLNVDIESALSEQRDNLVDEIRAYARQEKIRGLSISKQGAMNVTLATERSNDLNKVNVYLAQHYSNWQLDKSAMQTRITPSVAYQSEFTQQTLQQNLKIMRDRIEELGITEALVQRQGSHNIRIELPGVQDPAQAKNIIGATATLAFHEARMGSDEKQYGDITLQDESGQEIVLAKRAVLTGEHITNARAGIGEMGQSEVNISLDSAGGHIMSAFSGKHIGRPMATVYREYSTNTSGMTERVEKVISVATIQSQLGNQFRITGAGSMQDAQDLALLLRAGSLTAPVTIVEERTIGASLGAENIENGFAALAMGMGMTLVFMALWYRRLGWVANIALVVNLVCLLGLITLLPGAVLTLPGIAGLVLTVGMAVDTNVLIFERIKDKMAEGRSMAQSIDTGFASALSTILDANITTMITAFVLYSLGNGPLQGFALTLGLGLLTSMFSGIFVSRALINLVWGKDARREVRV